MKALTNAKPVGADSRPVVGVIDKSHSSQLRVLRSTWKGQHKVELADFSSVVPGTYSQAGAALPSTSTWCRNSFVS
jgi:hypothetical protein